MQSRLGKSPPFLHNSPAAGELLFQEVPRVPIPELYARPELTISFEFFPPKTDEAEASLFREVVPALQQFGPGFISVTYGAGGGTRDRTLRMVHRLQCDFGIESMAHLTCVGSTRTMLASVLDQAAALGIRNILALRGDPPRGQATFQAVEGGFSHAIDLIRFVKSWGCFHIGAAGYPEGHAECPDKYLDWDRTAAKVEAGAEFLITQLFYDVNDFLEFTDYLRHRRGVTVPIVPGILPFLSAEQIHRFTSLCGARLPPELRRRIDAHAHDDEAVRRIGVEVCTEMCRRLLDEGVPGFHIYCLNRVPSAAEILHNLGLMKPMGLGTNPSMTA
ncbi:MAG: methylenetetrahydrofolate reductase [NAD(P)H] [Gemmataceae bacterium]|nr:methylenetetrahydrofolate reductase [NAD(P)H] [Gemmataceae bacterium]MDW8263929.1 methylenetetrahydrofolate reductase [NAD(P)H] [Gemmataceae bacterium]